MKDRFSAFIRLTSFELKKSFCSPWMLVFLIFLLILNGVKLSSEYIAHESLFIAYEDVYDEFYERWSGELTEEKVTDLMTVYTPYMNSFSTVSDYTFDDGMFFTTCFYEEMRYDYLYRNTAQEITKNAKELYALYESAGNTYEMKKNAAIANTFSGRHIDSFYKTDAIEVWMKHDYSAMLVMLLSLFGLCTVFVSEKETEMYMLQRTTHLGGSFTVTAKLTASFIFIITVCALFFAEDIFLPLSLSGKWDVLGSPIYAVRYFENTSLNMTVGGYIIFASVMKTVGTLSLGILILLLSCLCRRVLSTFISGFTVIMLLVILSGNSDFSVILKAINPMELLFIRDITAKTEFVNVFGHPVLLWVFVLSGIILISLILFIFILYKNPGHIRRK